MARDFAADDTEFYRAMIKDENVVDWLFLAGPYETPGMAKSQGTRKINEADWNGSAVKVAKVQRLEAVVEYEEHYNYEGERVETPVAKLKWVDYLG